MSSLFFFSFKNFIYIQNVFYQSEYHKYHLFLSQKKCEKAYDNSKYKSEVSALPGHAPRPRTHVKLTCYFFRCILSCIYIICSCC